MTLKDKSKLEAMLGKAYMYRATLYTLNDFHEIGDKVLIGTDIKTLSIPADKISEFITECLPADNKPSTQNGALAIPGIESNYFSELAAGLMSSFREIQGSKDEKFLKEAKSRAAAKVAISKGLTDIAKTAIAGAKAMRQK